MLFVASNNLVGEVKMKIGYLAYPYRSDPQGNTMKVRRLALRLMKRHPTLFLIVPHFTVDNLLEGSKFHERAIDYCLALVEKADLLILGTKKLSEGMQVERGYAHKKRKQVKYATELLRGKK